MVTVTVLVTPDVQVKYGLTSPIATGVSLAEPITCDGLLFDVLPDACPALKPVINAVLKGSAPPYVVASTHHTADAVMLLFSTATEATMEHSVLSHTAPDHVRIIRVHRGHTDGCWDEQVKALGYPDACSEVFGCSEILKALGCPAPFWGRVLPIADKEIYPSRVKQCQAIIKIQTIPMDPASKEQCAWAREFLYATLLAADGTVFVANNYQEVLNFTANMTTSKILMHDGVFYPLVFFKQHAAVIQALRECTTDEALYKLMASRPVRVRGYGAIIPETLKGAEIEVNETDRCFTALVEVPLSATTEETLRRLLPGAPAGYGTEFDNVDAIPTISWKRFVLASADDAFIARNLDFWRTTTYCVVTYRTPFSVGIHGYPTRAAALEAVTTLMNTPGVTFWRRDAYDDVFDGVTATPEMVLDVLVNK